MEDKLIKLTEVLTTRKLAKIFSNYMNNIGIRKYDGRRKDNTNSYYSSGKYDNWNRVFCNYIKEDTFKPELEITLRKEAGYYLIIEKKNKIAVEVCWSSVDGKIILDKYNEKLFKEILEEYKGLFDELFKLI